MIGDIMIYTVKMLWDEDAKVWVATSEEIPGLILESGSYDALIEKIKTAAPELLALNDQEPPTGFKCCSERLLDAVPA